MNTRHPATHPVHSGRGRRRRLTAGVLVALLAQGLAVVTAGPAAAATFTVTSADDANDGVCDATHCSLREAITAANNAAGADTIAFGIAGPTPGVISPATALPTVTGPVVIDGSSQPGYAGAPVIRIDGSGAGPNVNGLALSPSAGASTITGLSITGFSRSGIDLTGPNGVTVSANHIGVDPAGTTDLGNGRDGVTLNLANNAVVTGNVISGNGLVGVFVGSTGARVTANKIGTDHTGTAAIPNQYGIQLIGGAVQTTGNVIGGTGAGEGNVISGNTNDGVLINGYSPNNTRTNRIEGNLIGTAADGTTPLANGRHGVLVSANTGTADNPVGGTATGAGNVIAHNVADGVSVDDGTSRVSVLGNSIHSNGGLGIDLGSTANNGQVPPVVTGAVPAGSVEGTANGPASTTVRVEAFASSVCDGSGSGEGERLLGTASVALDGAGSATFAIASGSLAAGEIVTATTTDADGNTSAFSPCVAASAGDPVLHVTSTDDADDGTCNAGHCSLREAIGAANANAGPDEIDFELGGSGPHTITPSAALPAVTEAVTIDGGSAPDCAGPPDVVLDGSGAGSPGVAGLTLQGGGSIVRGLVLADWSGPGLRVNSGGNTVQCNYVGTDATGTLDRGNQRGIEVLNGADNLIGGAGTGQGNLVSANDLQGIILTGAGSTGNRVEGNKVGTDVTGTVALGNKAFGGVNVSGSANTVGGSDPAARNLISGNLGDGVFVPIGVGTGNLIEGNWIGVDATGVAPLANQANGVLVNGASGVGAHDVVVRGNVISGNRNSGVQLSGPVATDNTVEANLIGVGADGTTAVRNGPPAPASPTTGWGVLVNGPDNVVRGNTIANTGTGVQVGTSPTAAITGVTISENAIDAIAAIGIDLGGDGVTANDADDSDTGANQLMNTPVLTAAIVTAGATDVTGTITTTASTAVHVEVFGSPACGASGTGEGAVFLGATDVTTDAAGQAAIAVAVAATAVGEVVTATATDPDGNTSEFSACVAATDPPVVGGATDRIAFSSNAGGTYDIWTIAPDGTGRVQVTSATGTEDHPTWSPDGTRIAYAVDSRHLEIVNHDGSGTPVRIHSNTTGSLSGPDWSPDGTRLAFDANTGPASGFDVKVIGVDGTGVQNLTLGDTVDGAVSQDGQPVWSPDGTRLGITRTWVSGGVGFQDVWLIDPSGVAAPVRLTTDGRSKTGLGWLPDGSALTYQDQGLKKVTIVNPTVSSIGPGVGSFGMSWSRNGQRLAWAGNVNDLFVRTVSPLSTVNVTNSGETVFYPEWYQAAGQDAPTVVAGAGSRNERFAATQTLDIPLVLTFPSVDPVTVDWRVVTGAGVGNAAVPDDLPAQAGTVVFAPGETSASVALTIVDDPIDEWAEWAFISLSNATNATIGGVLGLGFGSIGDNDPLTRARAGTASGPEGDSHTTVVSLPVDLTVASGKTVTVDWVTVDAGATAGVDYVAGAGTLTFPPGTTRQYIDITVLGDTDPEGDELIGVLIGGAVNAKIAGYGIGLVEIVDDDTPA